MYDSLKPALTLQIGHLLLSCAWNIAGVILISKGLPALGPTASLITVVLLITLATLLIIGARKWAWLYLSISLILLVGTIATIVPAFNKPPTLWPSDFWRYAGVALNSMGAIGALFGLKTYLTFTLKNRTHRS